MLINVFIDAGFGNVARSFDYYPQKCDPRDHSTTFSIPDWDFEHVLMTSSWLFHEGRVCAGFSTSE